jgi:hypothetical protein
MEMEMFGFIRNIADAYTKKSPKVVNETVNVSLTQGVEWDSTLSHLKISINVDHATAELLRSRLSSQIYMTLGEQHDKEELLCRAGATE